MDTSIFSFVLAQLTVVATKLIDKTGVITANPADFTMIVTVACGFSQGSVKFKLLNNHSPTAFLMPYKDAVLAVGFTNHYHKTRLPQWFHIRAHLKGATRNQVETYFSFSLLVHFSR